MTGELALSATPVELRHIKRGPGGTVLLGTSLVAQPKKGVNGTAGYQSGRYERATNEPGEGSLVFPNANGEDGVLHRRRFGALDRQTNGYHPGDEWIEVTQDGALLFVGTPDGGKRGKAELSLRLRDAWRLLERQRETAAGFWNHAPRDVFEHYTKAWRAQMTTEFLDLSGWTQNSATLISGGGVHLVATTSGGLRNLVAQSGTWGTVDLATQRAWRLEMTARTDSFGLFLTLVDPADLVNPIVQLSIDRTGVGRGEVPGDSVAQPASKFFLRAFGPLETVVMAIECRDRWVHFYINGSLFWSAELAITATTNVVPMIDAQGPPGQDTADVYSLTFRRCDPFLMRGSDKGTYRLPGSMPPGGLRAAYFDDGDIPRAGTSRYWRWVLAPTRKPYATQQDATIDHASATPPAWQPATPPNGEYFSVRWTGSIYLDLAAADVTVRLSSLDNAGRVWIGKTRYNEWLISQWPTGSPPATSASGSLRTHLGTSESAWYPIVVEYANQSAAGGIKLERSISGGAYSVVPATALSPYGIYEQQVRFDSHAEQLQAIINTFGYQTRLEPRALESGLFPGELVPRIRVGRDTDKILKPSESVEGEIEIAADEVIDTLLADAAGIVDPAGRAQLTAEAINYAGIWQANAEDRHAMILGDYQSLADITDAGLLRTRLDSLLGLRIEPWEEVSVRPRGHKERRDTFPLTGAIALFDWEPGDALRLQDEDLDLDDLLPRQIVAAGWGFNPNGRGAPTIRFRQRPRTQARALRELYRAVLGPQRNYQGQIAVVSGSPTALNGGYSEVALPANIDDVITAEFVVLYKGDTSAWTINDYPAGSSIAGFTNVGRVDVLGGMKRRTDSLGGIAPSFIVQIVGGTNSASGQLELTVRV